MTATDPVSWLHQTAEERSASVNDAGNDPDPDSFFTKKGLATPVLGRYVRNLGHVRMGQDGRLHRYTDGVYRGDGDDFVRVTVRQLLGDRCRSSYFDETLKWLRAAYPTVSDRPPEQWINVRNGLLDWRTGTLEPHTPDVVTTVQLPVPWRLDATCPTVDQFLADVLPADAIDLVWEVIGYTLYAGNPLRRAVLAIGAGANGKSTWLRLIRALVGPANCSAVPLQVLAENRFAVAELFGRLANIAGDLDARAVKQTDIFKMATGGDPLVAERKYGAAFSFVPFATFLFAANEAPISSDQSEAWFDRWLILPFDRRFTPEQADPHLEQKLTTPDELAGALVHAITALRALIARGRFDQPPSVEAAGDAYRSRLDTVRAFLDELCVIHPDAWVPRPGLYQAYRRWCADSGRLALAATNFNDRIRSDLRGTIDERTRNGTRGWIGVGLIAAEGAT